LTKREKRTLVILKLFFSPIIKSVFLIKPWSMRRWYRHLVGFGRKASSQLFEGVFQSENPRVGGRGGEGQCGRPEYSIHIATTATTHSDDSFTNPSVDSGHIVFSNMFLQVNPIIILPPFNF
jgi:hypothetical protein